MLIVMVLLVFGLAPVSFAEPEAAYISDQLVVPLRTGPTNRYRIIRELKSGEQVDVLKTNQQSGYVQVRTQDVNNNTGWLPKQYLMKQPSAASQLIQAEAQLKQFSELKQANDQLSKENENIKQENSKLTKELTYLKKVSANAANLDQQNQQLKKQNHQLKEQFASLTQQSSNKSFAIKMFIAGGVLVIISFIAGLVMRRRQRTDWQ
jgi:SH3 domain protein